jgi:hypothetical protein
MLVCEQLKSTIESPQALPVSICASVTVRVQYSLNTQGHSSIKMTPFETVFGQKTNDGICVGLQETDEEKVEYMFDTDRDLQTGVWTDNGTDSQTETETVYFTQTRCLAKVSKFLLSRHCRIPSCCHVAGSTEGQQPKIHVLLNYELLHLQTYLFEARRNLILCSGQCNDRSNSRVVPVWTSA